MCTTGKPSASPTEPNAAALVADETIGARHDARGAAVAPVAHVAVGVRVPMQSQVRQTYTGQDA
jgi:hypothetical protein